MLLHVVGNIGSGKTTAAKILKDILKSAGYTVEYIAESAIDNPFLNLYFKDPARYSFHMQLFTESRLADIINKSFCEPTIMADSAPVYITDFGIPIVFARLERNLRFLTPEEFATYTYLRRQLIPGDPEICCGVKYFFLDVTPETCLKRIKSRNQRDENFITIDYLNQLNDLYWHWLTEETDQAEIVPDGSMGEIRNKLLGIIGGLVKPACPDVWPRQQYIIKKNID